jgi:hypothetical protein
MFHGRYSGASESGPGKVDGFQKRITENSTIKKQPPNDIKGGDDR